jgi:hypothetical protein
MPALINVLLMRLRRRTFPAVAIAMISFACGQKEPQRQQPHVASGMACGPAVISEEGVGYVTIGRSADSVVRTCTVASDAKELDAEGMPTRIMTVRFGSDSLRAEIVDGRVWRIEVETPAIRTTDSLGVGTPISRLLSLQNPKGAFGEGFYVLSPEHCGLSFQLSTNENARPQDSGRAMLERLPSSTVVTRVLIVGCQLSQQRTSSNGVRRIPDP